MDFDILCYTHFKSTIYGDFRTFYRVQKYKFIAEILITKVGRSGAVITNESPELASFYYVTHMTSYTALK